MQNLLFDNFQVLKQQIYAFSERFETACICDSNGMAAASNENKFELIAGFGCIKNLPKNKSLFFDFLKNNKQWVFGNIEYQNPNEAIKNGLFVPEIVFEIKTNTQQLTIINNGISEKLFAEKIALFNALKTKTEAFYPQKIRFKAATNKAEYIDNVNAIKQKIKDGVFYEINYCMGFDAPFETTEILNYYLKLIKNSPAPFAAFYKNKAQFLLCNSPERFLKKEDKRLVSQPIKGTNKVAKDNVAQMEALKNSPKEQAENVMIVDLVRNDLARVCKTGSIAVTELFGVYAFKSLNHLISTIVGELKNETTTPEIFSALFPMGSMTGAPKVEVMKNIQMLENISRTFYSGCIGYFCPQGNFDFNVVIRTLEYNHQQKTISYKVGSAITFDSDAEQEYDECLLKAKNVLAVFG